MPPVLILPSCIVAAQGPHKLAALLKTLPDKDLLPDIARTALEGLMAQLDRLAGEIHRLERRLLAWHRPDEVSQRLETIPGVGVITATALAASVSDPAVFRNGRQFAAFLGLVPRQNSSGGKDHLGRICKMGDGYLRRLLVVGATSVIRRADKNTSATGAWVRSLLERKPARIAWAVMARGDIYHAPAMELSTPAA
tara:strand:- start:3343 stop:3930 length:588 start_codon:yes stop_codon:yes gene_type:complete